MEKCLQQSLNVQQACQAQDTENNRKPRHCSCFSIQHIQRHKVVCMSRERQFSQYHLAKNWIIEVTIKFHHGLWSTANILDKVLFFSYTHWKLQYIKHVWFLVLFFSKPFQKICLQQTLFPRCTCMTEYVIRVERIIDQCQLPALFTRNLYILYKVSFSNIVSF